MAYEKKNMSGSLFKNTRKEKDSHPDYQGDLIIDGTHYWLSGWLKEGSQGKFFSLAVKPKEQRREEIKKNAAPDRESRGYGVVDDDSNFPF